MPVLGRRPGLPGYWVPKSTCWSARTAARVPVSKVTSPCPPHAGQNGGVDKAGSGRQSRILVSPSARRFPILPRFPPAIFSSERPGTAPGHHRALQHCRYSSGTRFPKNHGSSRLPRPSPAIASHSAQLAAAAAGRQIQTKPEDSSGSRVRPAHAASALNHLSIKYASCFCRPSFSRARSSSGARSGTVRSTL